MNSAIHPFHRLLLEGLNGAAFSNEKPQPLFRYALHRELPVRHSHGANSAYCHCSMYRPPVRRAVMFLMLNPSDAGATHNDPTINKCMRYGVDWGFTDLLVGNVFAFITSDPRELRNRAKAGAPVVGHPDNAWWLVKMINAAEIVVCAWGANADLVIPNAARNCVNQLVPIEKCRAIKINADDSPTHPLFLKSTLTPRAWP